MRPMQKLFVGGLKFETTEEELREYFSKYGELSHINLPRHRYMPGRNRGFAFITFVDVTINSQVIKEQHTIAGRVVDVKISIPKANDDLHGDGAVSNGTYSSASSVSDSTVVENACKIFVGGLANSVDDAALESYFSQFGPITSCTVMMDKMTNRSRGFGFVVFENENGAYAVFNGNKHVIHNKPIDVKQAVPRDMMISSNIDSNPAHQMYGMPVYYQDPSYPIVYGAVYPPPLPIMYPQYMYTGQSE